MSSSTQQRPYRLPYANSEFFQRAMAQPMRAECSRCGNDFQGSAQAGIDWFRLHRCICKPPVTH